MKSDASLSKARRLHCKNKARYSTTGRAKSRQKQLDRMELIDAQKQQLNLNSHLKKVAQVVASSLKVKM